VALSLILCLLLASPARGARATRATAPGRTGFGITVGDPFGLSLKHWGAGAAWDVNLALAYGPGFRFGADYLWTLGRLTSRSNFDLNLYAGAGPFVGILRDTCGLGFFGNRCNNDVYFGARVPLGVEMLLAAPFEFGLEVAPGLGFAGGSPGFVLDLFLALRAMF
jgi:hypothetical protein